MVAHLSASSGPHRSLGRAGASVLGDAPPPRHAFMRPGLSASATLRPMSDPGGDRFRRTVGASSSRDFATTGGFRLGSRNGRRAHPKGPPPLPATLPEPAGRTSLFARTAGFGSFREASMPATQVPAASFRATSELPPRGPVAADKPVAAAPRPDLASRDHSPEEFRQYSKSSRSALSQLSSTRLQLERVENRVAELTAAIGDSGSSLAAIKTELALLEANMHKLEAHGIDDIYTGELQSARAEAKQMKRSMLTRLESLFETFEKSFAKLKAAEDCRKTGATTVQDENRCYRL
eukprot:TRINITY_DN32033_c0_g1_i2.p1 TRINITY_DN32033_c0_g1~~TRINITY_DN32033_c0_g1_i2.p1  ORF type:complete len:293 (+),score=58.14 TRINITY_DN32033_c0_g1_i2:58-936(+)